MNINEILAYANRLRDSAESDKEFEEYEEGIDSLTKAIDFLRENLAVYEEKIKKIDNKDEHIRAFLISDRNKIAARIADFYGMKGGQYRRMHQYEKAIEMYDNGLKYESNPEYQIINSYNLSNSIAVRIINDGHSIDNLRSKIKEAIKVVTNQVQEKRKDEWWAWADLGQLCLLDGQIEKSLLAYKQVSKNGAGTTDFESIVKVLTELSEPLHEAGKNEARFVDDVRTQLLDFA